MLPARDWRQVLGSSASHRPSSSCMRVLLHILETFWAGQLVAVVYRMTTGTVKH